MSIEPRPVWDFVVTYDGADYRLDLNRLTKREEILCQRKTGLDRQEFIRGFLEDEPEATLFGVWLALRRELGDSAPPLDDIDLPTFGDWVQLHDEAAATAWVKERAAEDDAVDPTPPADGETTS